MMSLDPGAAFVLDLIRTSGRPGYESMSPEEAREAYMAARLASTEPPQEVALVEPLEAPGPRGPVAMRHYRPLGSGRQVLPLLVYFHGGGWVLGNLDSHDGLCRQLAHRAGCAVISVDYRLAPEHKFPAAVDDAFAATNWIFDNAARLNADAGRIALGGDSAGGNLAIVTALNDALARRSRIRALMLIYPATDFSFDTASQSEFAEGHLLTRANQEWFHSHYLRSDTDRADWRASPMRADDLSGLPYTILLTASHDPLRDEGEAFARRLVEAGVTVTLKRAQGQIHGFLPMEKFIPAAKAFTGELAELLAFALRPAQAEQIAEPTSSLAI
ncbi:alpha/beta hydrolase [Rhodoligotrophos defluvii]|uniref:alpha/beta hydrolase n=1 Tax=Rhodoligotrophos defluvii TaxID=2561934 RepID=UPI0010C9612D|nr:alpha/beta hydrolase [Rhodoligotrophos defluvii]